MLGKRFSGNEIAVQIFTKQEISMCVLLCRTAENMYAIKYDTFAYLDQTLLHRELCYNGFFTSLDTSIFVL